MTYEFKITLKGIDEIKIWRKIKVNENITFRDLHLVIQDVMGWYDCHMYQFSPKGWGSKPILSEDEDEDFSSSEHFDVNAKESFESEKIKINQYFKAAKDKIVYIYDFGDDWQHDVVLTKINDEKILHPVCLDGSGACPFEDCGGIGGYLHYLDILKDRNHEEYEETIEWLCLDEDEDWDENFFDVDEANELLRDIK